jgi:DNA helicase-2/ATP-dependent DNA helicase PcrA
VIEANAPTSLWVSSNLGRELHGLVKRQLQPVLHSGSSAVLAGPGSGKTRVLVAKAALLLETEVQEPYQVACITFTRSAAMEIRERLVRLAPASAHRVWAGTVHGFCLNAILRPFSHLAGMPAVSDSILSTTQQVEALQLAFDKADIGEEIASLKALEGRGTRIRRRVALGEGPDESDDPRWYKAMRCYDETLRATAALDFEAITIRTLALLRDNPEIAELVRARYPWLLVDEYQDLGGVLHEIVLVLAAAGVKPFVVGDPNQCIMSFSGAAPEYFHNLRETPGVKSFDLAQNFRCSERVAEASLRVLGVSSTEEWEQDEGEDGGFTRILEVAGGVTSHAAIVTAAIAELFADNPTPGTIAVLYKQSPLYPGGGRKIDVREALLDSLMSSELEFSAERGTVWPRSELIDFLRDCAIWAVERNAGETGHVLIRDLLRRWARITGRAGRLDRVESQRKLYCSLLTSTEPDLEVGEWLGRLDSSLDLASDIREGGSADSRDSLKLLGQGQAGSSTVLEFSGKVQQTSTITLTTYHSAKGREWDYVFLPYIVEAHVPGWHRGSWGSASNLSEGRRALHVAISRARVGTTILTSEHRSDEPKLGYRSRFLAQF